MVEEKKKEELEMVEVLVGKVGGKDKFEEKQAKDGEKDSEHGFGRKGRHNGGQCK